MRIISQQSGLKDVKDAVRYQQIINSGNIEEICKIAEDPNTPPSILSKLSVNKSQDVRKAIAKNPNTPPDVLTKLSNDMPDIRTKVAENPNTPRDILVKLCKDPSVYVRKAAINNPNMH